jgi:anti-sigma B factor antagonist
VEWVLVTVTRNGCERIVYARGEFDVATCSELADVIEPELGSGTLVVVDLSEVTYMDSSCLNVLIRARRHQEELGGSFGVQRPSRTAQRLLTITGLQELIRDA